MRWILFSLSIWLVAARVYAADPPLRFSHIGEEDGLPDRNVTCLLEDRFHFLWIGTVHGLFRHDGSNFLPVPASDSVSRILGSAHIMDMIQDGQGNIWIATFGNGLAFYDAGKGSFRLFLQQGPDSSGLSSDQVSQVAIDPEGKVWVSTTRGLCLWQPGKERFRVFHHEEGNPQSLVSDYLVTLLADQRGEIWVGSPSGVSRMIPAGDGEYRFLAYKKDILPNNSVWSLAEGTEGQIWMTFVRSGYGSFDPLTETFTAYPMPEGMEEAFCYSIFPDDRGYLWIPTSDAGMARLHVATRTVQRYYHSPTNPYSIGSNAASVILPTEKGRWWVGHSLGLSYCYPYDQFFRWVPVQYIKEDGSTGDLYPTSLVRRKDGLIYVGTGKGIYQWDGNSDKWSMAFDPATIREQVSDRSPTELEIDREGRVWIGTVQRGPVIWDPATGQTWSLPEKVMGVIRDFYEDEQGGMWIAVDGKGLGYWQPGWDSLAFFHWPDRVNRLPQERFSCIVPGGKKYLWIGGIGEGLNLFDREKGVFVEKFQREGGHLSNDMVLDLCADAQGHLWIATQNGLNLFDPESRTFRSYFVEDGLPSNSVRAICLDAEGFLWMGTDKGFLRFDPAKEVFRSFSLDEGLASNRFGVKGGKFWGKQMVFTGDEGLTLFNPAHLPAEPPAPEVVLSGFKVLNEPYDFSSAPEMTQELVIDHKDYAFTFEFAAPGAFDPSHVAYAYRLEGLDEDWNYVGKRQIASYTALSPGSYTFFARVVNAGDPDSTPPLQVKLRIRPAFWQTLAFKILIGLLAAAVLIAFLWLARRQLEARHQKALADQRAAYKSQFLANMSHEIRTPMHSVMSAAELLAQTDLDTQQKGYLDNIRQAGKNLLALINDILDFTRIEAGKLDFHLKPFRLEEVLAYVKETLKSRALEQKTEILVEVAPTLPPMLMGDPVRLGQILLNLIGNAIKYAPGGQVQLKVKPGKQEGSRLRVDFEVADTGIGIPPQELPFIFESFKQGGNRLDTLHGGVGLGLAITRELVEQQGGEIGVESEVGRGTVFRFSIPFALAPDDKKGEELQGAFSPDLPGFDHALVVEDIAINRELAVDMLQKAFPGLQVHEAGSGEEALARLAAGPVPDLILMDIRMPDMDGLTCTRLIRKRYGPLIPVLALTASATREEVLRSMKAGLDGLLPKPFTPGQLASQVNQLMSLPEASAELRIDYPGLRNFLGNDESRLQRYLAASKEEILKHFRELRAGVEEEEWEKLQVAAHSLKTTFRYLGVKPLAALAEQLENAARDKDTLVFVERAPQMARLIRAFLPQMEQGVNTF